MKALQHRWRSVLNGFIIRSSYVITYMAQGSFMRCHSVQSHHYGISNNQAGAMLPLWYSELNAMLVRIAQVYPHIVVAPCYDHIFYKTLLYCEIFVLLSAPIILLYIITLKSRQQTSEYT